MGKYTVLVPELHYRHLVVEADDDATAIEAAQDAMAAGDDAVDLEFSHIIDDLDKWKLDKHQPVE